MRNSTLRKFSFLVLCLLVTVFPFKANAAVKAGTNCPKKGQIVVVGTKKFTCIQVSKKLLWNKGVDILPKKTEANSDIDTTLIFTSFTVNSLTFAPGQAISVSASVKSPAGVKETSMVLKNEKYPLVTISTGKLKSGSNFDGIWELNLIIPKDIDPQIYFLEVSATNAKGELVLGKRYEVDVNSKNDIGKTSNAPVDNSPRNSEGLTITCGGSLAACPALSELASDVSECKIERPTPNWENPMSVGFTRPKWIKSPFTQAEILVIPLSFSDLRIDDSFVSRLKQEIKVEDKWLETNSYGKFRANWTIADQESWFNFQGSYADYKAQLNDDFGRRKFVQDLLRNYEKIDLTKYKGILIFGNYSETIIGGMEFGGSIFSTPKGNVQGVSFTFGGSSLHLDHNLGHTIFAFEDLYLIQLVKSGTFKDSNPEKWDIMGGGSNFVAWHRWINGWILDNQVTCLGSELKPSTLYLTNLDKNDGKPKLISAVNAGIATMAEYRFDQSRSRGGLIVYGLDPKIPYGEGPMTGEDMMLQTGQKLSKNGITFEVIAADVDGIYVKVFKS